MLRRRALASLPAFARRMSGRAPAPVVRREGTTLHVLPAGGAAPTSVIVLMHGLGDTAAGWVDVAAGPLARALPRAAWVLPTASTRPVTINGGAPMPAWYDIRSLTAHRELETCDGIDASVAAVRRALAAARAAHGLPARRTVLAGAMALFAGLSDADTLAGVVSMSGYLPLPGRLAAPAAAALATPALLCHGTADAVVPLSYGADARDRLAGLGAAAVTWKTYAGMGHGVCDEELEDVADFLRKCLPEEEAPAGQKV